jgi:bifunctional non-homologous end joining protein LigD
VELLRARVEAAFYAHAIPSAGRMITNPDKLLFPTDAITKGDLAAYYEAIAPVMLPHVQGRPITMERFPAGIDRKGFLQKDVAKGFPDWLRRVEAPKSDGVVRHAVVDDVRSLLWLANQNCITPHVSTSRAPKLHHPDLCVFDLDPSTDDAAALRDAVLAVRDVLAELGLASWLKTSGSKGYHVVVPLDGESTYDQVAPFAVGVGALLVKRHPARLTQEFSKADRRGRILVDTGRNGYSATFAAPYAVRARPGAPVSAPCTWDELADGAVAPRSVTLRTMAARIAEVGDLWADLPARAGSLTPAAARLAGLVSDDEVEEAELARRRRPGPRNSPAVSGSQPNPT